MRIGQALRRARQLHGGRPALVAEDRELDWRELCDVVARTAGGLRELGVQPRDRVAILAHNSADYVIAFYAIAWLGGVFVPINTRLAPPEIVDWLMDSNCRAILVDEHFSPLLGELDHDLALSTVIGIGPARLAGTTALGDLADGPPLRESEGRSSDLVGLFYTGGTTGRSKGVMLSHDNLLSSAMHLLPYLDWDERSHFLHAAPMFHLADGVSTFAAPLVAGCQSTVPRFDAGDMLTAIEERGVTTTVIVPTMINLLTLHPSVAERDLSTWSTLVYGGSPIPDAVMTRAAAKLPGVALYQLYGQTEASPALTLLGPQEHRVEPRSPRARSAGRALVGCEITILDEGGEPVAKGEVGEICAHGDNVMLGYWQRPEETAQTLRDGWLHTGDAGYLDEDGYLFVVDRVKDMIVTGGENVYCAEVENALCRHPAVAEAVVIGIPAQPWGEQVHAVVRLHAERRATEDELIAWCRTQIANYKCPKSVEIRDEPLPMSAAGKYLKRALREPYWATASRQVN